MFCFVFGMPGGFAEWCECVALQAARRAGGSADLIRGNTLDEVALNAIGTRGAHAVVSSRQPGGRLRAALVDGGRNFVVALDDPRTALIELVLGRGVDFADAVQALAGSCAALAAVIDTPRALVLHRERDWQRRGETAAAVAHHLRLPVDDAAIAALVDNEATVVALEPAYDLSSWWSGLDPAERELAAGALAPFVADQDGSEGLSITWRRDLFFLGDGANGRVRGPVDITGRARCLLHGPYIRLPAGSWSLSLSTQMSRGAVEHEFVAEVLADTPLASGTIRPQDDGSARVALDFALAEATEHPLTLRISSQRAAFDGAIEMVGARLVRAGPAAPDVVAAVPTTAEG